MNPMACRGGEGGTDAKRAWWPGEELVGRQFSYKPTGGLFASVEIQCVIN